VTELLEKYLAMTVSLIILASLANPILRDGESLIDDCYRTVLVKILLDEIDFGISESLRTGRPYENTVLVPSNLSLRSNGCQLIISFSAFERNFIFSRYYSKPIHLRPPITDGNHLLHIASTDKVIQVSFRLM